MKPVGVEDVRGDGCGQEVAALWLFDVQHILDLDEKLFTLL